MTWRCGVFAIVSWACGIAQDATPSWYPLQPGDTWTYRKEYRDGNRDHPSVERWTTEETIVRAEPVSELPGTLVTKRTKVLNHVVPPDFIAGNDSTKRELPESHLLIYQNCVYVLDGADAQVAACGASIGSSDCVRPQDQNNRINPKYRDDLIRGTIPADYCCPFVKGKTWGRVPATSPAEEWVWNVLGVNGDPFGAPGSATFHLSAHLSSGTQIDRWFQEGVGVLQEVIEHHGTYDERRQQLLRATINGKTQDFRLRPARTIPLTEWDCRGSGWQHYFRADGASFGDRADCINYSLHTR